MSASDPPAGSPLRIALVSQEYPPETGHGGIGRQTHLKAHGLAALGHHVVVVSAAPDGVRSVRADGPVQVIRIPPANAAPVPATEAGRWLAYSRAVATELDDVDQAVALDLIDFPEWAAEGFVYLRGASARRHIPSVIQLHGPLPMLAATIGWPEPGSELHIDGMALEGGALRLADAIYSSSAWSAQWIERAYGIPADRVPIIHAGVDLDAFRPRRVIRSARPTVAFVGRIARSKGVGVLVEAAIGVAASIPTLRVRLVGRDPDGLGPRLVARAVEAGFPDLVQLVGSLHGEALVAELAAADVFAAPSQSEGGPGFTFLEAMGCGLPVIGPAGTGVEEAVVDGVTGVLIPPDDAGRLAAAIAALLADRTAREAMGARARAHVLRTADTRQCIARLEAFYRSVIGAVAAGTDESVADPALRASAAAPAAAVPTT